MWESHLTLETTLPYERNHARSSTYMAPERAAEIFKQLGAVYDLEGARLEERAGSEGL